MHHVFGALISNIYLSNEMSYTDLLLPGGFITMCLKLKPDLAHEVPMYIFDSCVLGELTSPLLFA